MPSRDPSIENEPHLQMGGWKGDPSEAKAAEKIDYEQHHENIDDVIDQSVWSEPGLSPEISGPPPKNALTYENWLNWRISQTGFLDSWALVFCWAFIAGPLAVLGVLLGSVGHTSIFYPIQVVLIGPVAEELMKIAIPLWVIERRAYLFKNRFQIFFCALASGVVFAAVENVMYLNVDLFNWENPLTRWRWTVCVALHTFCCLISALGLSRIWIRCMESKTQPNVQLGVPYFVTAIVLHGTYNAFAILFEVIYEPF